MEQVEQLTEEHRDRQWVDSDGWTFTHVGGGKWLASKDTDSYGPHEYDEPVGNPHWGGLKALSDAPLEAFERLPLPVRMRAAAKVLDEARAEYGAREGGEWPGYAWNRGDLHCFAQKWERQDAQEAERDALAVKILRFENGFLGRPAPYDYAKFVLDAGYRKVDD